MIDVLVTGAGGQLGSVLMRVLTEQGVDCRGLVSATGPEPRVGKVLRADIRDPQTYKDLLFSLAPRAIVHLAAVTQVAAAYNDPDHARDVNVDATVQLSKLANALGARFIYASTDLVFDGEHAPYDEDATTEPVSFYGRTKLEAECHVLAYQRGLCVRFPLMYGRTEVTRSPSFFDSLVSALRARQPVQLFEDEVRTPLWLDDAAHACITLIQSDLRGVVHVAGPERLSRFEMGERIATALAAPTELLQRTTRAAFAAPEPRARDVSLNSERFRMRFGRACGRAMHEALPLIFADRSVHTRSGGGLS